MSKKRKLRQFKCNTCLTYRDVTVEWWTPKGGDPHLRARCKTCRNIASKRIAYSAARAELATNEPIRARDLFPNYRSGHADPTAS